MSVKGVANALIDGHGNGAFQLAEPCLVYGPLVNVVCSNTG